MKRIRIWPLVAGALSCSVVLLIGTFGLCIPLNLRSKFFWWLLIAAFAVFLVVRRIALGFRDFGRQTVTKRTKKGKRYKYRRFNVNFKPYLVLVGVICLYFLLSVSGSSVFNASKYSSILTVSEADFSKDISESVGTDSIALMDTASARMLGDREIGSLSSVVSQFNVSVAD